MPLAKDCLIASNCCLVLLNIFVLSAAMLATDYLWQHFSIEPLLKDALYVNNKKCLVFTGVKVRYRSDHWKWDGQSTLHCETCDKYVSDDYNCFLCAQ